MSEHEEGRNRTLLLGVSIGVGGCLGVIVICLLIIGLVIVGILDVLKTMSYQGPSQPLGTLDRLRYEIVAGANISGTVFVKKINSSLDVERHSHIGTGPTLRESDLQKEITAVLKALHRSEYNDFKNLIFRLETPLDEPGGWTYKNIVVTATFNKTTLDKVDLEYFSYPDLNTIVQEITYHPVVKLGE
ncbi:hypothetical protein [Gimesia sp.]|uniref:hypothetical protein n=1 Tax=Gimesia sp. TaxID=2024833 RepID=UPI003A8CEE43